jgi:hypothetical protein
VALHSKYTRALTFEIFVFLSGGSEGETLAIEALADLYFLSECEVLVGTGSSHFVAVAKALILKSQLS